MDELVRRTAYFIMNRIDVRKSLVRNLSKGVFQFENNNRYAAITNRRSYLWRFGPADRKKELRAAERLQT